MSSVTNGHDALMHAITVKVTLLLEVPCYAMHTTFVTAERGLF